MHILKTALIAFVAIMIVGMAHAAEKDAAELEQQMEQARIQLEEATAKIAQLSRKMASSEVRGILQHAGSSRRAVLGVHIGSPDDSVSGVVVEEVMKDGPAASAGLQANDVITYLNGVSLTGSGEEAIELLLEELNRLEPDQRVAVQVMRDSKPLKFDVTLASRAAVMPRVEMYHGEHHGKGDFNFADLMSKFQDGNFSFDFDEEELEQFRQLPKMLERGIASISGHPMIAMMGGPVGPGGLLSNLALSSVDEELGAYFGVEHGALVTSTPEDKSLGLKAGDVIVAINDKDVLNQHDARRALIKAQSGQSLVLDVVRQREALTVDIVVPQFDAGDDWNCEKSKDGHGRRCIKKNGDAFTFNFDDDE